MSTSRTPKIGLALGSGASRGWSHIGVLKALNRAGIEPDVIAGTSVGAMIGACYLSGNLDKLEEWVLGATQIDVFKFFEIHLTKSGFVDDERFADFLHDYVIDRETSFADLPSAFATVATDVQAGRETWLTEGNVLESVRASMSLPGLFPTVRINETWLVDGGLVNPVPVSTCRAIGADIVIAVNLNTDLLGKRSRSSPTPKPPEPDGLLGKFKRSAKDYSETLFGTDPDGAPGLFDVVANSINIFQDRITRSRLAGDPADIAISPKLAHIGMLDFHRAAEAIREGEERTERVIDEIKTAASISR
jgi:NTE family protein